MVCQDTAYQGLVPDEGRIHQSIKKPCRQGLNSEQKALNREIFRTRAHVEHAIGSIKRLRILKDGCRLRKNNFVKNAFATGAAFTQSHNLNYTTSIP